MRNTINWKQQAIDRVNKCRDQIKTYIENGIDRETALNMVLNESTIGAGFKAQIRYEFK